MTSSSPEAARPLRAPRGGRQTFQPGLWSRLIVIGAVAVYAMLFVVLNTRRVKVSFVFVSTRVSLIWVILLSLAVGLVLGVLPRSYTAAGSAAASRATPSAISSGETKL